MLRNSHRVATLNVVYCEIRRDNSSKLLTDKHNIILILYFVDFSKAFVIVNRNILFYKEINVVGMEGHRYAPEPIC